MSNPRTCTKLSADGTRSQVVCENLQDFQGQVGGPIELVEIYYDSGKPYTQTVMLVNEEGLLQEMAPINIVASTLAGKVIVGDVLIVPKSFLN